MTDDNIPGALRPDHAAAYLGIGRATLYKLCATGDGPPSYHVGRRRLFRRAALDRWMRAREAHAK